MSDIRVDGYQSISFWKEESIGIIVLRSDDNSGLDISHISELVTAVGTAAMDDSVKAVALTGINMRFATHLNFESNVSQIDNMMDYTRALLSLVYTIDKPIFSILNGNAIDVGYEIALLADVMISSNNIEVGFSPQYTFMLGGSITSARFKDLDRGKPASGVNSDLVYHSENLLDDAKKYITDHLLFDYPLIRRRRMISFRESLLEEREHFFKRNRFQTPG
ncbi:3-hydroxypropionyl-coenzyme A dehydratase [Thermoplasmatales archaeon]|nr:3-hydroxypropionyl-coenzyme A dehydratase [Thermoplasmatales archaeon]